MLRVCRGGGGQATGGGGGKKGRKKKKKKKGNYGGVAWGKIKGALRRQRARHAKEQQQIMMEGGSQTNDYNSADGGGLGPLDAFASAPWVWSALRRARPRRRCSCRRWSPPPASARVRVRVAVMVTAMQAAARPK